MIGKSILHYKIIEKLGEGGMGIVYLAEDNKLERKVAIKFLPKVIATDSEERRRFEVEAKAAAALNHPNIATIYAIEEDEEQLFLVMEYIEGKELSALISESHPLPFEKIREYAKQIASGLKAAHDKGVIHRDIKSSNIMINTQGDVKIMDFGLAKYRGSPQITQKGKTVGTVAYMSPEQIKGEDADLRSDVWSFGIVLYELLTGQLPFHADYDQAIMYAIVNEALDPPASHRTGIPEVLNHILKRTLEKDLQKRYTDFAEVLDDLGRDKNSTLAQLSEKKKVLTYALMALAVMLIFVVVAERFFPSKRAPANIKQSLRTLKQVTFSEDLEEYPGFSADGIYLVYSRQTEHFKHIFTKNLISGEVKQITSGGYDNIQPVFTPDGEQLLFVRSNRQDGKLEPGDVYGEFIDGDIWKINLATGNEALFIEDAYNPSFSTNGNKIAFDASWVGPRRIWIADAFGRNPQQLSYDSSEAVDHILPRWSADDKKIVYQNIEKTKINIASVNVTTKSTKAITNDLYTNINPVWSGDGNKIYFSSYRSGGRNIWCVNLDDAGNIYGEPEQITTGAGEDVQLAVSGDGKKLAFSTLKINADIWRIPVSRETGLVSGEPQALIVTTREDSRGAWSYSGQKIAFNSDRSGDMNIWVYSFSDKSQKQITRGQGGDYQPNWSPGEKDLVFFSSRSGNSDIWKVNIENSELSQLTDHPALDMNPFFSPNGQWIAFQSDRGGRREVWVMRENGSGQKRLTSSGCMGHFMRWSQDSRNVIYRGMYKGDWQLLKVAVSGGDPQPFAVIKGGSHISFSPDYSRIMDVTGHITMWVTKIASGDAQAVYPLNEIDFRIDYPVWSPDGKWVLFDRVKPRGGDIWMMEDFE